MGTCPLSKYHTLLTYNSLSKLAVFCRERIKVMEDSIVVSISCSVCGKQLREEREVRSIIFFCEKCEREIVVLDRR